jgi:hypothetical protein
MSDGSLDADRLRLVGLIVNVLYDELVKVVIADIKALGERCRQSGDDSGLSDVWEEFKYQMQRELSIYFDAYEDTIRGICENRVATLEREKQLLLWLWTDAYFDQWYEKDEVSAEDCDLDAISKEVYDRVCVVAEGEELAFDPDENRDRERYEDDVELLGSDSDPDQDAPDHDGGNGSSTCGPDGSRSPPPS